jgi:hypothetical protein
MAITPPAKGSPIPGMKTQEPVTPPAKEGEEDDGEGEVDPKEIQAFLKRVDRKVAAKIRMLASEVGLENLDAASLKAMVDKAKAADTKDEETRRAQMTEIQRHKDDVEKANKLAAEERARAEKAEERATQLELKTLDNERQVFLKELAGDLFDLKAWKHVLRDFDEHYEELSHRQKIAFAGDKTKLKGWFAEYAKENPRFTPAGGSVGQPTTPREVPLQGGANPGAKTPATPPGSGGPGVKTAAPGRSNSMSDAKWQAKKKEMGW